MKMCLLLLLVINCQSLFAVELADPLIETQKILRDSERVQQEALVTPAAKIADKNASITGLGKPENKQEIYNIAADLMPMLVEMSSGDPAKMQELIAEAYKNPKAFYDKMPITQRDKIKLLSETIDSTRTKNKAP